MFRKNAPLFIVCRFGGIYRRHRRLLLADDEPRCLSRLLSEFFSRSAETVVVGRSPSFFEFCSISLLATFKYTLLIN